MVKVENDRFQVLFESIGEGYNGDYDPDDPKDIELLRFTVFEKKDGEWEPIDDCSYCTLFPTNTPRNIRLAAARLILDRVTDEGVSKKKLCERLSWIEPEWVQVDCSEFNSCEGCPVYTPNFLGRSPRDGICMLGRNEDGS